MDRDTDAAEPTTDAQRILHGPPVLEYWRWRYAHEVRMRDIRELDVRAWAESLAEAGGRR